MANNVKYEQLDQWDGVDPEVMERLERRYAFLIGKFLLGFSYIEHSLDVEVSELINERSHDQGYTIIKNLSYAQKVELLNSLSKPMIYYSNKGKKKKSERLEFVKNGLTTLGKLRNNIAHANWYSLDENGYVRIKIKSDQENGMIKFEKRLITPDAIKEGIKQIDKVLKKLDGIWETISDF